MSGWSFKNPNTHCLKETSKIKGHRKAEEKVEYRKTVKFNQKTVTTLITDNRRV